MDRESVPQQRIIVDGNTAAAMGSYPFCETVAIYPITPSSPMAETADVYAESGVKNGFNQEVRVVEMESEAGAAGAVHGAAQAGSLATTYTASQGLLLMLPNMYKWVGEELPIVVHVAARTIASHALSIFGDHQDIYAARPTGIAMLCSHSVQDVIDLSAVAHLIAIGASYPIIHFFDGFRTSHEYQKVSSVPSSEWFKLLDRDALSRFRTKALDPHTNPVTRGSAQNDDVFFQAREAQNLHQAAVLDAAVKYLSLASQLTGREYAPFVYTGAPDAERVIVAMGSVTQTAQEVVDDLNARGEKVGLVKVYLYRPFSPALLSAAIPASVKSVAVLDRTKEPLATGEPLYLDVLSGLAQQGRNIRVVGGRYGLSSHDTIPADIKAVFDALKDPTQRTGFTIGIKDDVTHLSLASDPDYSVPFAGRSCLFYGMGSDGTVSANKMAAKIIGDITDMSIQAYFQYDSKKAGGITRSHLRFGHKPIRAEYYIREADFISCSQDSYIQRYDMLRFLKTGGIFLLNTSLKGQALLDFMPGAFKRQLAQKRVRLFVIDANTTARALGLGRHTNTILESSFFWLNRDAFDFERAISTMKEQAKKTYARKGEEVVAANLKAIDMGTDGLEEIPVDPAWANLHGTLALPATGDAYMDDLVHTIESFEGYSLPVSAFVSDSMRDGSMRNGTTLSLRRSVADIVPEWQRGNCIQCGQCVLVCPHATIRAFLLSDDELANLPESEIDDAIPAIGPKARGLKYRIQISPMNCLGCTLCAVVCPGKFDPQTKTFKKALIMKDAKTQYTHQMAADYLYNHVENRPGIFPEGTVKDVSLLRPYHEVSGSCAGCGETPYYRLLSQLFGPDLLIANATGCSSIYCGSYPLSPFVTDKDGQGVAWANSLFEDNAEFGYGMRIAKDVRLAGIVDLIRTHLDECEPELRELLTRYLENIKDRKVARELAPQIVEALQTSACEALKPLIGRAREMVDSSVWIVGGDGWAYDIGYGGLDHVLASKADVNILVLDTEVYSNTGGQASKASQTGQIAKFAATGKRTAKKNLALMAMTYNDVYVAQIALGANQMAAIKALRDAESYHDGPSIVIAYCPCIEHGIKGGLANAITTQKSAVQCGYWPIYRYDPRLKAQGKPALALDAKEPDFTKFKDFVLTETRYSRLHAVNPEGAEALLDQSVEDAKRRYADVIKYGNQ